MVRDKQDVSGIKPMLREHVLPLFTRKTGKSTRIIDEAVGDLFRYYTVGISDHHYSFKYGEGTPPHPDMNKDLVLRFLRRLEIEHGITTKDLIIEPAAQASLKAYNIRFVKCPVCGTELRKEGRLLTPHLECPRCCKGKYICPEHGMPILLDSIKVVHRGNEIRHIGEGKCPVCIETLKIDIVERKISGIEKTS